MSLSESKLLQAYRKMRQIRDFEDRVHGSLPLGLFLGLSIFTLVRKPLQLASACTSMTKTALPALIEAMVTASPRG